MNLGQRQPIRVMRVISRMNVGGPAVQVSGLMRGLSVDHFEQRLYTGFCAENEADYLELVATDVKSERIQGFGRRINFREDLKAFISLVIEIRKFHPHIIHTHTAKAGILGRTASIVSLVPSIRVHTFHGHLLNGYFGKFKRSIVVLVEKFLSLYTHQLLAVGVKVREDLLLAGIGSIDKFGIMPPGVNLGKSESKAQSQRDLGLKVGKFQCAYIGRVTKIKRPDRFLDVVREMLKRGCDLEFFIAGDGEDLKHYQEVIIREMLPVKILGWQLDIEKVLAAADVVILTSDNEGTPLSLIQAGMSGLPVVSTNVGSVSEVILDGVTGFLTNLNSQELADALEKLMNDKILRSEFGLAAKKFTMENFGVRRLVFDHENLYKDLASNQAKS